jgi:hypothetical protein
LEILRLENIIYIEVKRRKLEVFKISYGRKDICLFVYNLVLFNIRLQHQVIKLYHKVLNMQSIVQRFGLCERYIIYFLRAKGIDIIVVKKKPFYNSKYPVSIVLYMRRSLLRLYIGRCR